MATSVLAHTKLEDKLESHKRRRTNQQEDMITQDEHESRKRRRTNQEEDVITQDEDDRSVGALVRIDHYLHLKENDEKWESLPLQTISGYPFRLIVRPNGLKWTEEYGNIAIWLKPLPCELVEPAKMKLSVTVNNPSGRQDGLRVEKDCMWDEVDTICQNPAFCFDLSAIKHSAIEAAHCIDRNGSLTLTVEEDLSCLEEDLLIVKAEP